MRGLLKGDGPFDPQVLQLIIQCHQGILRVVPASALVNRDMNIVDAKVFHQVENSSVPITSQDLLVIPMYACNEDPVVSDVWNGLRAIEFIGASFEQSEEVNEAQCT